MTYEDWKEMKRGIQDELEECNKLIAHEFPIPKTNWRVRIYPNGYNHIEVDPIDPNGMRRELRSSPKSGRDFVLEVKSIADDWRKGKIDDLEAGLAHLNALGEFFPGREYGTCGCGRMLYQVKSGSFRGVTHTPEDEGHHLEHFSDLNIDRPEESYDDF